MKHKSVIIAFLVGYLLVSMVPQIGLMALMGKGKGSGGTGGPGR